MTPLLLALLLTIRTMVWCVYDKEDQKHLQKLQGQGWKVKESRVKGTHTIYILQKEYK